MLDFISPEEAAAAAAQASSQEPSQERDGSERLQSTEEHTEQVWYEGTTDEGRVYYWNNVTQGTQKKHLMCHCMPSDHV